MWPHLAYKYYTNSLKVEVSQSHPVLKAFCGLLLDIMVENGPIVQKMRDAEEGTKRSKAKNYKQISPCCYYSGYIFLWILNWKWKPSDMSKRYDCWNGGPSVCSLLVNRSLVCSQASRRTGAAKPLLGGGSAVAGSCSTRWSTTPHCWVPGSTSKRCRRERTSSTGSPTAALWKAARRMRRSHPPRRRQTRLKMREILSEHWASFKSRV